MVLSPPAPGGAPVKQPHTLNSESGLVSAIHAISGQSLATYGVNPGWECDFSPEYIHLTDLIPSGIQFKSSEKFPIERKLLHKQ